MRRLARHPRRVRSVTTWSGHSVSTPRSVDLTELGHAACWLRNSAQGRNDVRHWSTPGCSRHGVGAQRDQRALNEERGDSQHALPVAHVLVVEWSVDDAGEDIAADGGGTEGQNWEPQSGM